MGLDDQRARASTRIDVTVSDEQGRPVNAAGLGPWLMDVAPGSARGTVNVALVSDRMVRALNRRYRRKNATTDVLSFPAVTNEHPSPSSRRVRTAADRFLGDIVIARGVAGRQARQAGHSPAVEWRVLALHGLLHLLGYDHERDDGTMARVERRLRRKGGLPEGLTERETAAERRR